MLKLKKHLLHVTCTVLLRHKLVDLQTHLLIEDVHRATLKTSDPANMPLPSRDSLMLQCFMILVLRMAGRCGQDTL